MKKTIYYLISVVVSLLFINNVNAAGVSISATSSTTVGSKVVVRVNASGLAGKFSITSSNGNVLSGGTGSVFLDNESPTFTFDAKNVGTATITVTPIDVADYSGNVYSAKASKTITVKAKPVVVLSKDDTLSSLGIEGKELTPAFSKDVLEYSVELDPDTTSVNVVATPSNGGATINGAGVREVQDGANRLEIVVTAENGSTRTYVINANVKEFDPIKLKINNSEYTVVRKKSGLGEVNGYTETTVTINGTEVPALKSEVTGYTLVALKDKDGKQNYYIKENDKYTLYKEFTFNKVSIAPLELDKIPNHYKKVSITYNDEKITAYKTKASSKYALIYGMNIETGEKHIYMYDSVEDTLQIYNEEEINTLINQKNTYLKIIIGLGTLSIILFITNIILLVKRKKVKVKKIDVK